MVKKVNGFYITKNTKHKFLVKFRPFSSVKIRNPENIIFHVRPNDLNSEKTASLISNPLLDLANYLENETNSIHDSLIVPWNDNLNNNVNEVNGSLINMCQQWNTEMINHTDTIDPSKHLNESHFHLNRYGTMEFAINFKKLLYNLDWFDVTNTEVLDHYEANNPVDWLWLNIQMKTFKTFKIFKSSSYDCLE